MREDSIQQGKLPPEPFIVESISLKVTLVNRVWGKKMNLICIFQKEDGSLFSAVAWRNKTKNIYSPRRSLIDFKEVDIFSVWICEFSTSKHSRSVWLTARAI